MQDKKQNRRIIREGMIIEFFKPPMLIMMLDGGDRVFGAGIVCDCHKEVEWVNPREAMVYSAIGVTLQDLMYKMARDSKPTPSGSMAGGLIMRRHAPTVWKREVLPWLQYHGIRAFVMENPPGARTAALIGAKPTKRKGKQIYRGKVE